MAATLSRVTPDDYVSLVTDVGPAPVQVGAVLLLNSGPTFDTCHATRVVAERISAVPRLRQHLMAAGFGRGRPVWVDAGEFDISNHVHTMRCPGTGNEEALLTLAAELVTDRLPDDRPLWRLTFVTGLVDNRTAILLIFHHVLADGIGGLAVLANLVDGAHGPAETDFPRTAPTPWALASDAATERLTSVLRVRDALHRMSAALHQLRPVGRTSAERCSLNRPTGPRRRLTVVRVDLGAVLRTAHAHDATVNDVVLTAVATALHRLLLTRGERVDRFVVSVPVSARPSTTASELGNDVGVIPMEVAATGEQIGRLESTAQMTRAAKATPRGASTSILGPLFRVLARLGIFNWFINRQRSIHTFVTNLHGPAEQLQFMGSPIVDIVAIGMTTGNVDVAFAVLSYAGALNFSIIADPDVVPDLNVLRDELATALGDLLP